MFIFLLIYMLGFTATLWNLYRSLDSGDKITLSELSLAIIISVFSWVAFIITTIVIYGDKTVFEKK